MEDLKLRLHLNDGHLDEDPSVALTSLITSSVREEKSQRTLLQIADAIVHSATVSFLEPLTLLPLLLPCSNDGVTEMLQILSAECSAKEVVMAAEEALETMRIRLGYYAEDEDEYDNDDASIVRQLVRLIHIYSRAIPRLPRRSKSPSQVLKPIVDELSSAISQAGNAAIAEDRRALLASVTHLVISLHQWISGVSPQDAKDEEECHKILRSLLNTTLDACSRAIRSHFAQKAFESQFPRLVIRSPQDEAGSSQPPDEEYIVTNAWAAMTALGVTVAVCESEPSICSLIFLAHNPSYTFSIPIFTAFFPVLIAAIQSNTALDSALALLLRTLPPLRAQAPPPTLPPPLVVPLVQLLSSLAGVHSDPGARQYAFRLLGTALALAEPTLRLHLLHELLTDADLAPKMRVASVGLAKEAVLEALADAGESVLASPAFLRVLGPVVLRPDPPDLFAREVGAEEFLASPEPLRLVECLAFYYVLLSRDVQNRTGVRDRDAVADVERALVGPLRTRLALWNKELDGTAHDGHEEHGSMQLDIVDMWLERVSSAMNVLPR